MKAALLKEKGHKLAVVDVPAPKALQGSVIIRVTASHVLSFAQNLFGGNIPVPLPTPYIPGPSAIGIIEEAVGDTNHLKPGQHVFCNPYITSQEQSGMQAGILKGWFGLTMNCGGLLEKWKDGSFAEQAVYPIGNVTPFEGLSQISDAKLSIINYLCIAYGGLLKAGLRRGQTVLINGATGNMGSAAVLVALAMGASKVFAVGRNQETLNSLSSIDPHRIAPICLEGPEEGYGTVVAAKAIQTDVVLDTLGSVGTPFATAAAVSALKNKGIAVFIGGVYANIPLNYYDVLSREITITGSFMYPAWAPGEIIRMIRAGLLNIEAVKADTFRLHEINEAVSRAAVLKGLYYSVLIP